MGKIKAFLPILRGWMAVLRDENCGQEAAVTLKCRQDGDITFGVLSLRLRACWAIEFCGVLVYFESCD
jgi:hypothetical protein